MVFFLTGGLAGTLAIFARGIVATTVATVLDIPSEKISAAFADAVFHVIPNVGFHIKFSPAIQTYSSVVCRGGK